MFGSLATTRRGSSPSVASQGGRLTRSYPGVVAVEPDAAISMDLLPPTSPAPVSPSVALQTVVTLDDPRYREQWYLPKIGAPAAWETTTGKSHVIVAIIDSGVDYRHPDLAPNLWRNPGETGLDATGKDKATNGVDDDQNGYVDDVHGIDARTGTGDPIDIGQWETPVRPATDSFYHGTFVAGLVGAVGNNREGIAGLNWSVRLMAINRIGGDLAVPQFRFQSVLVAAWDYLLTMKRRGENIRITVNSYGTAVDSAAERDAMALAGAEGMLSICAAMNVSANVDLFSLFPAAHQDASIITVAASTPADELADFSNFGPGSVDLAAPGTDILSTWGGARYRRASGTSFAAPLVAGAAALLLSVWPELTVDDLKAALFGSVTPVSALRGKVVTGGHLNVAPSASPGQRLDSLAAIADAARIRESLELRNDAIAALALTDIGRPSLGGTRVLGGSLTEESPTVFDRAQERVAYFLPDGGLRVEGVKNASQGVRVPPPEGDPGPGYWLGFSPDGRFVAARYASGMVVCWEVEPLRRWVLDRLEGSHWVSTGFSMDSAWLVAGASGHLRAYALTRGQEPEGVSVNGALGVPQRKFEVTGLAGALAFEGESRYLAVILNAAAVRILDWRDGRVVTEFSDPEGVTCLAWHPDSRQLLTGSGTGAVRVWDTLSGSHRTLTGHRSWIHGLALHPRGDVAASQSWDETTKLWDLAAERPLLSTEEGHALEFDTDGKWLGFRHNAHQHGAWPVAVSRVFRALRRTDAAWSRGSIDFSPDGRLLIWTDPTGVWRQDLRTGWYARRTRPDVAEARFSADGKWLVLAGAAGLERWGIRQESDRGLGGMELVGEPECVGTHRFGMYRCQIGGSDAGLWMGVERWSGPKSYRVLLQPVEGEARVVESPTTLNIASIALSRDGRWLALGHQKGAAFVFDPATGGIVHHWPELEPACVGFTPDGTWLVTGTGQRYQAWRPGTWQPGWTLPRENAGSVGGLVAFANDGRTMAVLKSLGTMELLDWRTGEIFASLTPPRPQEVFSAAFSPDGGLFAVLGDSEIQIWDLGQLRTELASLGLDWSPPAERTPARSMGDLVFRWAPDDAP